MSKSLEGKVGVITGASSGIGAATARAMARAGMNVVLMARRADRLAEVAESVQALGQRAHVVVGDVADPAHVAVLLDTAERAYGRFDVVFANAGYGLERPIHEMTERELREIFEVNFFSSVALLREAAIRLLRAKQTGHLVMCSSCVSKFSMPDYGAYAASKAAQESVSRAMRFELADDGIEVSSVHPITTATEFFDRSAQRSGIPRAGAPDHAPKWMVQSPDQVARAIMACLRRPRAEIWTSHIVRFASALFTAFPSTLDLAMRGAARRQRRRRARDHQDHHTAD